MLYGYFDQPFQETPAYDPGLEVACPICGCRLSRPMKTISLLAEGDTRSYFYRVHQPCYEKLSPEQISDLDGLILDPIFRARETN